MEWTITDNDLLLRDLGGVEGLIERMEKELRGGGTPIEGFRLLSDAAEMLSFSHEIEREVRDSPDMADLYVGFQTADTLAREARRYRRLVRAGVKLAAFGQCRLEEHQEGLEGVWTPLPRNTGPWRTSGSWCRRIRRPSPSSAGRRRRKNVRRGEHFLAGKQFRGFITNDCRVVHAVIAHLESLRARAARSSDAVVAARRVLAVTSLDDSPEYSAVRSCASRLAAADGGEVVLFEISAASYLVSPYPEENRRQWIRTLREPELRRLGRSPVAKQLEVIRACGAEAQAILPTSHGFRHLAEWAEREDADVILIPVSLVNPGLFERLRGYSLKTLLEHTTRPVLVVYPDGSTWRANPEDSPAVPARMPEALAA